MNGQLPAIVVPGTQLVPTMIADASEQARLRFLEFFASNIRNPNTRRAYSQAVAAFLAWCETAGVRSLTAVQPLHVASWIEIQAQELSAPTVKQRLAALRHLFDWMVTGQVIPTNPAGSVRGPRHSALKGKTPVLDAVEARQLLDSIDVSTQVGLRDRALLALMVFSFARVGAALAMKVEDVYIQNRRLWIRLREKGGKRHEMPCHHTLEVYLHAYLDGAVIADDAKGPLFRTIGRGTNRHSPDGWPIRPTDTKPTTRQRRAQARVARKSRCGTVSHAVSSAKRLFRAQGGPSGGHANAPLPPAAHSAFSPARLNIGVAHPAAARRSPRGSAGIAYAAP
jgi:site-specific recombinase XerC